MGPSAVLETKEPPQAGGKREALNVCFLTRNPIAQGAAQLGNSLTWRQKRPLRAILSAPLVGVRTAPHAWWPELARPKSLKFTYRNRAIRTGVFIVWPIGSFGVGLVI